MPGSVFLDGEDVTLRTIEEEDLDFLQRHINDPAVRTPIGATTPVNATDEREWFESMSEGDDVSLLVCADGDTVGTISLMDINADHGFGELGYWIAPDAWGEGYATAATRLLVGHAFDQRRLHKVSAKVFDYNTGSQRVLEKVGFTGEGVDREEAFVDGEYVDVHRYGLLEDEWRELQA
ncbi:GNAT family N-acetyltransferase [Halococcus salsus]|uniref:GNAT family N-acetyltransferase n=1 Tax=Halococcus salsus TaxID=2162894 RepID=UPI00135C09BF|nr:GNAT family protein [Halococcus salsus]